MRARRRRERGGGERAEDEPERVADRDRVGRRRGRRGRRGGGAARLAAAGRAAALARRIAGRGLLAPLASPPQQAEDRARRREERLDVVCACLDLAHGQADLARQLRGVGHVRRVDEGVRLVVQKDDLRPGALRCALVDRAERVRRDAVVVAAQAPVHRPGHPPVQLHALQPAEQREQPVLHLDVKDGEPPAPLDQPLVQPLGQQLERQPQPDRGEVRAREPREGGRLWQDRR
mmetsp:Transcript_24711/g.73223  ORF Transcript_24711/g.73223 Transcript_24711/m.73223 type:complete len:233 (-) Transcript_24711:613-1311(-)